MKLLKIGFSAGGVGKTKGCEKAPDMIEEELKDFIDKHKFSLDSETVEINNLNLEETDKAIQEHVKQKIGKDEFLVILGGDHSITYSCFKAFNEANQNAGLLVFDSHADVFDDFALTHENYLRKLVNEGLSPKNIIIVGLRNIHKQELSFLLDNRIRFFSMQKMHDTEVFDSVMETARSFSQLYVSVDIDVVDPAFAPATGHREPGGFTSREFLQLIARLKNLKNIKAIDIVEVNPDKDMNNITSRLAANIVGEFVRA